MNAGKHVSVGGAGRDVRWKNAAQLIDVVKRTGLTYMMAETSYFPTVDDLGAEVLSGRSVRRIYACESEYHHDGLQSLFFDNGHKDVALRISADALSDALHRASGDR